MGGARAQAAPDLGRDASESENLVGVVETLPVLAAMGDD
jgi:hypothetical protein